MDKMNLHTPLLNENMPTSQYQSNAVIIDSNNSNNNEGEVEEHVVTLLSFATPPVTHKAAMAPVPAEIAEHLRRVHERQAEHNPRQPLLGDDHPDNGDGDVDGDSDDTENGLFGVMQQTFSNFKEHIERTPPMRLMFVLGLVLLLIAGNTMQVVFLNMWLQQYPPDGAPGNYTTFAVSAFLFSALFLILLVLHIVLYRPDLRFTKERRGWLWLLLAGWLDTLNSSLAVYAASHTPAILQALFTALVPIYAAVFTKLFLKDLRSYHNNWIRSSFSLIIAGVLLASVSSFDGDDDGGNNGGGSSFTRRNSPAHFFALFGRGSSSISGSGSCSSGISLSASSAFSDSGVSASSSGSSSSSSRGTPHSKKDTPFEQRVWALLFCLSVPVTVLLNVTQTLYMTRYTFDPEFLAYTAQLHVANETAQRIEAHYDIAGQVEDDEAGGGGGAPRKAKSPVEEQVETVQAQRHAGVSRSKPFKSDFYKRHSPPHLSASSLPTSAENRHHSAGVDLGQRPTAPATARRAGSPAGSPPPVSPVVAAAAAAHASFHYGNDTTVKLVMLTTETMLQSLLAFLLLPMDAMPWYGSSSSVQEAWKNFMAGLDCLVHCPNNFICCCLYSSGFVFVYVGAAYLNQYSVTLCSMVSQLGGPTTAILLLLFPVLNVTDDAAPWYWSTLAILIMIVGTFIYVLWDNMTEKEKIESELLLKMRMFDLCDDDEVREVEEDVRQGRRHRSSHNSSTHSSATGRRQPQRSPNSGGEEREE